MSDRRGFLKQLGGGLAAGLLLPRGAELPDPYIPERPEDQVPHGSAVRDCRPWPPERSEAKGTPIWNAVRFDTRAMVVRYAGDGVTNYPVKELYLCGEDWIDEPENMTYEAPMFMLAPGMFSLSDRWKIDPRWREHLYDGSLQLSDHAYWASIRCVGEIYEPEQTIIRIGDRTWFRPGLNAYGGGLGERLVGFRGRARVRIRTVVSTVGSPEWAIGGEVETSGYDLEVSGPGPYVVPLFSSLHGTLFERRIKKELGIV